MKISIVAVSALCILLAGCAAPQNSGQNANSSAVLPASTLWSNTAGIPSGTDGNNLPDTLLESYYLSPEEPVHAYLQNHSIQKFFNMWFKEAIDSDIKPNWNYDSLAPVQILDHQFHSIARPGSELYTCTFSTDDGRCGYILVSYGEGEEGPFISKYGLYETTPYQYDLNANSEQIAAAIKETDIDLATATAVRVEWIDTEKKRGDRIILFTDGKRDRYICYLGEENLIIEKL